jgi:hypothetical protein
MNDPKTWTDRYLEPLIGAKVYNVGEDEEGFPYIELLPAKAGESPIRLEISRDEEGNGPGFIFGLPHPEPEEGTGE